MLRIETCGYSLVATLEEERAPRSVEIVRQLLPIEKKIIHVRWSGEGVWIPLGRTHLDLSPENETQYPGRGEVIVYSPSLGNSTEAEILIPYGGVRFGSKAGHLTGNHFATIVSGTENLPAIGERVLWEGAQTIRMFEAESE